MGNYKYRATDLLSAAGMADRLQGVMAVEDFSLGSMPYSIPEGIDYDVTLSNVGDAIVATGHASAVVHGECARCLEPAEVEVHADIEGYYALGEESDLEGMEEDEYEFVDEDGTIDLTDAIYSSIVVEMPSIFLCRDDCLGLCPKCGCNRNVEQCSCADEPDEMNPFSVLKDFFKDDAE